MKESTRKLLEKADRSIETGKSLLGSKDMEFVASRAYYAMFYAAEAMLNERDMDFKKHSGVHSAFGKTFVKNGGLDRKYHQWLIEAFNERLISDYAIDEQVTPESSKELLAHAEEFLAVARKHCTA